MSITVKNEKELLSKAMSIIGSRMTKKRMKHLREVQAPMMRSFIKARKLNAKAVADIRKNCDGYKSATALAKKYGVNVTTVLRTKDGKYHANL
jgi:DNA invertase Pin-like site-specific DNA recombinase